MKTTFTYLSLFLFTASISFAQNKSKTIITQQSAVKAPMVNKLTKEVSYSEGRCKTPLLNESFENWLQDILKKQEQFVNGKKASVVYTIPIIFHIIHTGQAVGSGQNLSATRINQQIARLNLDYRKTNTDFSTYLTQASFVSAAADMEINFCAATKDPNGVTLAEPGLERLNATTLGWPTPPYSSSSGSLEGTIKPASIWDPNLYFNVWVTAFNDGTLGYAQFPTIPSGTLPITDMVGFGGTANTDGVVLDYLSTGNSSGPYNLGRTLTHEAGHWLGLRHINGDSSCGNDFVTDTPAQNSLSGTCPSSAGATVSSGCAASPNPPGRMYQNYMDYSDDKCMVAFTAGQKARMQAVMANCARRNSLNSSNVCGPVSVNEISQNLQVSLFPNPSNGELNVTVELLNTEDISISVINTLGQTVKEVSQLHSNGGIVKLDLSANMKGVYFVTVKTKSGSKTKRFILQ